MDSGALSEQLGRSKERRAKEDSWVMQGHPISPLLAGVGAGFGQRRKRGTRDVGRGSQEQLAGEMQWEGG